MIIYLIRFRITKKKEESFLFFFFFLDALSLWKYQVMNEPTKHVLFSFLARTIFSQY
jgi:hypothetical protein